MKTYIKGSGQGVGYTPSLLKAVRLGLLLSVFSWHYSSAVERFVRRFDPYWCLGR